MLNKNDILQLLGLADIVRQEEEEEALERSDPRSLRIIRKNLRLSFEPFTMLSNKQFKQYYRMSKTVADSLIELLRPILKEGTASKISVRTQVLVTLRLLASGGYQVDIGQNFYHPTSQSVVSRSFDAVIDALNVVATQIIQFPGTPAERLKTQRRFQTYNRISGILGLIDCVVIKFLKPKQNEEAFYNYKHKHSMNVQIVSNADMMITDIRICPGSNNDQNIWNHSKIKGHMEQLRFNQAITEDESNFYLIADPNSPEAVFTRELCRTRCRIEQLFGILVNVWRILKRERAMRYKPKKVAKIIVACAVLHNFCRMNGMYNSRLRKNMNFTNLGWASKKVSWKDRD